MKLKLSWRFLWSLPNKALSYHIPFRRTKCSCSVVVDKKHTQSYTRSLIISILRSSSACRSLQMGMAAQSSVIKSGLESDLLVVNNLLHMYCACYSIQDAIKVFDEMSDRDVVSWNTIISGFVGIGFFEVGCLYYCEMRRAGLNPSQSSFASVIVALVEMGSIKHCKLVHGECLKCGFSSDRLVGNALLAAYVRLGDIDECRKIFGDIQYIDEVSVEILLRGYVQRGNAAAHDVLELVRHSFLLRVSLSHFAISSLLSFCATVEATDFGIQIHGYVVKVGLSSSVSIVNSLVTMYAKCYRLKDSICLFDEATMHDIITWNSLIAGHAFTGEGDAGLHLIARLLSSGMQMNESTFCSFLSSCSTVTALESAKKAHGLILKLREPKDPGIDNIILTMYCNCEDLNYATSAFYTINEQDVVSYNLLIGLHKRHGLYKQSVELFSLAWLEGSKVDEATFVSLISCCSQLIELEVGKQIHCCMIKSGFQMFAFLGNSLLEMYSRCGRLDEMENIFHEINAPDAFTWNTKAMSYAHFGFLVKAFKTWEEMKESGVDFNEFSYCGIIDTCSCLESPLTGDQVHTLIKKLGLNHDTALLNCMLTMYASCGMMEKAFKIFQEIPENDAVSWNAMVCGYAQNGIIEESVRFYLMMNRSGLKPNYMTFASISKSCAECLRLSLGLQFHTEVIKRGYESYVTVTNSFINMYGKCGNISDSLKIFTDSNTDRDLVTWNSMICAYACHGYGKEAIDTFLEMKVSGETPNAVTFLGVLSACGHAGLLSEALAQFASMYQEYSIVPSEEHFSCMVDILCRAGRLSEAKELIERMPFDSGSFVWRTLLSACRTEENVELGLEAAEKLMQLKPDDPSAYVLLSNIYASAEKMEEKAEIRRRMGERNVKKEIGYSWV
ncbi:hypothetical protein Sjap_021367 [Stephania japonica]|uniref:Pentatricopeptide repeat-containing protein n=1 Tax=Stephania japonica TaxID=461633 RepID=A0AAP0EPF6_9MAGN